MANFDLCFSFVLPNEDYDPPRYEIVPDPLKSDPDAKACAGINSHWFPSDFAAIAALPQEARAVPVANFYRVNFWDKWLEQLDSNRLAAMTLDAKVNQGGYYAAKFLQIAVGAEPDGYLGPNTIVAANSCDVDIAIPQFITIRQERYREVGGPALNGWLARAAKIPSFS